MVAAIVILDWIFKPKDVAPLIYFPFFMLLGLVAGMAFGEWVR